MPDMPQEAIALGVICIVVGLFGIVVPVLPGLFLVWVGTLAWALLMPGTMPWAFFAAATLIYLAGIATEYLVPGRRMKNAGVRWSTQAIGVLGAIVGAFVIPVVGFFVGFPLAVFLWELASTRNVSRAWSLTLHALKGMGLNILIELCTGFAIAAVFMVGVVVTL